MLINKLNPLIYYYKKREINLDSILYAMDRICSNIHGCVYYPRSFIETVKTHKYIDEVNSIDDIFEKSQGFDNLFINLFNFISDDISKYISIIFGEERIQNPYIVHRSIINDDKNIILKALVLNIEQIENCQHVVKNKESFLSQIINIRNELNNPKVKITPLLNEYNKRKTEFNKNDIIRKLGMKNYSLEIILAIQSILNENN